MIALILLFVFLLIGISLYQHHKKSLENEQNQRSEMILQKVTDIQSQMQIVSKKLNQNQQELVLEKIENDLRENKQSLADLAKISDIQNIYTQLESIKETFNMEISDMKHLVSTERDYKHYLTSNNLPFHLTTVDLIAGEPYVTVDYDNRSFPMNIGDSLAGWRLIGADFESGFAEFMNAQKQYVKITI